MKLDSSTVVVITGASRGIGKEAAELFAKKGCQVALLARDENLLQGVQREIESQGGKAMVIGCDVSKEAECFGAIQKVIQAWGKIDVLVNNAGYGHYSSIENLDTNALDQIIKTNLFGAFWCTKAVIPPMKKQQRGHIVNISTVISKRAFPFMGAYCMSKFAMTGFDESLGLEVLPYGINVSLVCPGYTQTEFQKNAKTSGQRPNLRQQKGMQPYQVGEAIVSAVEKNKRRTILTFDGNLLLLLNKISPSFVDFFFQRYFSKI